MTIYQPEDWPNKGFNEEEFKNISPLVVNSPSDEFSNEFLVREPKETLNQLVNPVDEKAFDDEDTSMLLTPSKTFCTGYDYKSSLKRLHSIGQESISYEDISALLAMSPGIDLENGRAFDDEDSSTSDAYMPQEEAPTTIDFEEENTFQKIDASIQERSMSFETPPPERFRFRYESEKKRHIPKSRTAPTVVKLPNLSGTELKMGQMFMLRLIFAIQGDHPSNNVLRHAYSIQYHSADAQEKKDKTILIPVTPQDIRTGKKVLETLSITKTLLSNYQSELASINLSKTANESETDINECKIKSKKESTKLMKQYNLNSGRIICQLVIQINDQWQCTDIICEANVTDANAYQRKIKHSSSNLKRLARQKPTKKQRKHRK